ncbi:MAG: hypothetical protein KBS53_05315 [Bacteroidales bacterium]|nr:hypothetical protein [Candidatus Hennigimonas equi]
MKKEKKQLRELSEEDLKKVTGGDVQFAEIDDGDLIDINPTLPIVFPVDGTCPEGYVLVTHFGSSECHQEGVQIKQ